LSSTFLLTANRSGESHQGDWQGAFWGGGRCPVAGFACQRPAFIRNACNSDQRRAFRQDVKRNGGAVAFWLTG
jgi:hypothetical protein